MFLKVLHEHRSDGFYNMHGHDAGGIIENKIHEFFDLGSRLSERERADGLRAVFELEQDGFIMHDPSQIHGNFKILTDRGEEQVEKDLDDMALPTIDIDELLTDHDLGERVRDDFLMADFETAVFKAYKLLEERVRAKSEQPASAVGVELMSRAFKPNDGLLKHPGAATASEEEGLHHLMRGAMMLFKNPTSHRTVEYSDPSEVAFVLCFSNLLLNLADAATRRDDA